MIATVMCVLSVCIAYHAAADETLEEQPGQRQMDRTGCRDLFIQLDKAIGLAGIQDIQDTRIPDFPQYRVNRFLASFAEELSTDEAIAEWLGRLLRLGNKGRRVELENLPEESFSDLPAEFAFKDLPLEVERCAERLMAEDLSDPQRIKRIRTGATVADDYSAAVRVVGVNPVSRWFVMSEIHKLHDQAINDFQQPEAMGARKILPYAPANSRPVIDHTDRAAILEKARSKNALGIPEPEPQTLALLFDYFAPVWRIGTNDDADRIGRPFWQTDDRIEIDTKDPVVFRYHSYTRLNDQVLLQLNYLIWFPQRPSQGMVDIFSGHIDGLIWRVTLDPRGRVLLYDSAHPCGCYHKYFPVFPDLIPLEVPTTPEPPLILSPEIPEPEKGRLVIHISSREHYVVALSTEQEQAEDKIFYRFDDYSALRNLPYRNGHRSMFNSDGLVIGTERSERWLTWPMGVSSAGAMRQRGHYPLSLIGLQHFDDPRLFENVFQFQK